MTRRSFSHHVLRLSSTVGAVLLSFVMANQLANAQVGRHELKRQGSLGVAFDSRIVAGRPEVVITRVIAGSAADKAGIIADDVVLSVNGERPTDLDAFRYAVGRLRAGDRFIIKVGRGTSRVDRTIILSPRPFERAEDLDIVYGEITVDRTRRRTIITRPRARSLSPAILFITGVGCGSQDNLTADNPVAQLLYGLSGRGYVTMRVEKAGVGDSEGAACNSPAADFAAENRAYLAGLRSLKTLPGVDPTKVFILGLSIGGVIAPNIARAEPVAGIVVAETVGKSWFEYELTNFRRQMVMRGTSYAEVEAMVRQKESCNFRLYRLGELPERIALDAPYCGKLPIQAPAPYTYMRQVAETNLADSWSNVSAPVLVIYGASDFLTSAEEGEYIVSTVNRIRAGMAEFIQISDMDHFLARAASPLDSMKRTDTATANDEFQPMVLGVIANWLDIRSHSRRP